MNFRRKLQSSDPHIRALSSLAKLAIANHQARPQILYYEVLFASPTAAVGRCPFIHGKTPVPESTEWFICHGTYELCRGILGVRQIYRGCVTIPLIWHPTLYCAKCIAVASLFQVGNLPRWAFAGSSKSFSTSWVNFRSTGGKSIDC